MKSSNLAERVEEFEALEKLRLSGEPATQRLAAAQELSEKRPRRTGRARGIQTRDQGLRTFRVG